VPQVYLSLPQPANEDATPVRVLRGFEKVFLEPGASRTVEFALMRRDLSYWDVGSQGWVIGEGEVGVHVGFSSRDLRGSVAFRAVDGEGMVGKRARFGGR
jgi:beta-glucosidase